jgi:hypothetical protein
MSRIVKRVRNPEPFGKAGLTVAVIALVLAMVGGAYAAGKLTSGQKKEVEKIAKKYAGKPGAPGAQGNPGTNGTNGTNGGSGAAGKSMVVVNTSPPGCPAGGLTVEVEGTEEEHEICNGANGASGTFSTEPLPSGQSLTGAWGAGTGVELVENVNLGVEKGGEVEAEYEPGQFRKETIVTNVTPTPGPAHPLMTASISFPIEVQPAPTTLVQYLPTVFVKLKAGGFEIAGAGPTDCPGTFEEPKAAAGFLCIYNNTGNIGRLFAAGAQIEEAYPFGINLPFKFEGTESRVAGSWAVTAQ